MLQEGQASSVVGWFYPLVFFCDNRSRKNGSDGRWRKAGTASWAGEKERWISERAVGVCWKVLGCGLFPMLMKRIQEIPLVQLEERELTLRTTNPLQGKRLSWRGVRFTHATLVLFFFIY